MKVAIIGSTEFDSLEFHLNDELLVQGYDVRIFDFQTFITDKIDRGLSLISQTYVEKKNVRLFNKVLSFNPELVIVVYRHLHPAFVKKIKQEKIKIIHVNPDALTTFQSQQLFVEPYDVYFTKDPFIKSFMSKKLNLNARLYSEAFNERIHIKPQIDPLILEKETGIDVLCYGNFYPYRNRMLKLIKEGGFNITLFGNTTKYFDASLYADFKGKAIYGDEKAKVLNGAKIVFNNLHYAEIESVNNKFFEINGSGAFQICDYKPILKELLPIDPKMVSFRSIEEAKKLLNYYIDKPEKRFELRDLINQHFRQNYTYRHLVENILR